MLLKVSLRGLNRFLILLLSLIFSYILIFSANDARCFFILINLEINFNSFQIKYLTQKNIYINQFGRSFFFSRRFFFLIIFLSLPSILSFRKIPTNRCWCFFFFLYLFRHRCVVIHGRSVCAGCANRPLFVGSVSFHISSLDDDNNRMPNES